MIGRRSSAWAAILLAATIAQGAGAFDGPAAEEARPWPDDAVLESNGARVGTITLHKLPIFDPNVPGERKALYRLADRMHIPTRDSAIEAQLLFRTGDLYSRRRLDETERNLRVLKFIREPKIRIVGYHDGLVDLEVVTHETWSTNPGVSYGRSGGKNSNSYQIEETNLLGFGKYLAVDYSNDVDRTSYTVVWRDPNVFGSRWRNELVRRDSDDGNGEKIMVERPFYSLETRWSTGFEFAREDSVEHVYQLGDKVAGYRQDAERAEIRYGWSHGLQDRWTHRFIAGLRHEQAEFDLDPDEDTPAVLPGDRRLDYPFLRLESVQDDFEAARNRDQIARTEDFHYGQRYAVELGLADPAFGADRSAAVLRAEASRGFRYGHEQSLFLHASLTGRFEDASFRDSLLAGGLRFFRETGPQSKFYASLSADVGHQLDADHELFLGGDTGLRGYPLRYQTGDGRALLTLEERYYTKYSLWKLADVGGAVFFDMGRSWGESVFGPTENRGVLKDIGFGLRLGSSKTALGNVLHIDVAFPLDGSSSIDRAQLLIETKSSF